MCQTLLEFQKSKNNAPKSGESGEGLDAASPCDAASWVGRGRRRREKREKERGRENRDKRKREEMEGERKRKQEGVEEREKSSKHERTKLLWWHSTHLIIDSN